MLDRHAIGRAAEDQAAEYLISQGLTVVTRRFKAAHGEIDVVAMDGEVLVFVEVKARYAPGRTPEEAIGVAKLNSLRRAATAYMAKVEEIRECRFDVIAIDPTGIRHHRDILRDD